MSDCTVEGDAEGVFSWNQPPVAAGVFFSSFAPFRVSHFIIGQCLAIRPLTRPSLLE